MFVKFVLNRALLGVGVVSTGQAPAWYCGPVGEMAEQRWWAGSSKEKMSASPPT